MVSHDDAVLRFTALPEVTETTSYGNRAWQVRGRTFAWDRPFSKADLRRYGDEPVPTGPITALRVDGLDDKQAILEQGLSGVFSIPHLDGYAAVLVQLDVVEPGAFAELVVDAWLAMAPAALARGYLDGAADR